MHFNALIDFGIEYYIQNVISVSYNIHYVNLNKYFLSVFRHDARFCIGMLSMNLGNSKITCFYDILTKYKIHNMEYNKILGTSIHFFSTLQQNRL